MNLRAIRTDSMAIRMARVRESLARKSRMSPTSTLPRRPAPPLAKSRGRARSPSPARRWSTRSTPIPTPPACRDGARRRPQAPRPLPALSHRRWPGRLRAQKWPRSRKRTMRPVAGRPFTCLPCLPRLPDDDHRPRATLTQLANDLRPCGRWRAQHRHGRTIRQVTDARERRNPIQLTMLRIHRPDRAREVGAPSRDHTISPMLPARSDAPITAIDFG